MFSPHDTIVAIATAPGAAGLGIVRLSGSESGRIATRILTRREKLEPRRATVTRVEDKAARGDAVAIDRVVVTYFPAPGSFTGEDVLEIGAHGSPVILRRILEVAIREGARLATPGEFTLRAFLNGRLDLVQAEAIADLMEAATLVQARAAYDQLEGTLTSRIAGLEARVMDLVVRLEASLDFPDEGYHFIEPQAAAAAIEEVAREVDDLVRQGRRGRILREGRQIAIVGRPNVGKSSLFNALLGSDRAIVTSIPGTTRDVLTERIDVAGVPVTLVDTAGITQSDDVVEAEGVARAKRAAAAADATLLVLDRSVPLTAEDMALAAAAPGIVVANKCDLPAAWDVGMFEEPVETSVGDGRRHGLDALQDRIAKRLVGGEESHVPAVTNARHVLLLERVLEALQDAADAARAGVSEEFLLADLDRARQPLEELVGRRTPEDVLEAIFSRFCVGK